MTIKAEYVHTFTFYIGGVDSLISFFQLFLLVDLHYATFCSSFASDILDPQILKNATLYLLLHSAIGE